MNKDSKRPYTIHVVLVRSIYESNVGATSRAMANMGAKDLILIDPKCEITYSAQQAAASGQWALQNRRVYSDWSSFFSNEPEGIRISMTARDGRGRAVKDLSDSLYWLNENSPFFNPIAEDNGPAQIPLYLMFGPEDWGLSSEDLEHTHLACSIPIYGDNTSLNLAQAVLIALFIVRQCWGGQRTQLEGEVRSSRVSIQNIEQKIFPDQSLKTWLIEMGFDLSKPKVNVYSVLKRMILHNVPTQKELVILETVLQQGIRKLKEYNLLKSKP